MDFMASKENGSPQVWLGDFNVGPTVPQSSIVGDYESNYETIEDDGWVEANTFSDEPFCTFCPHENETGLWKGDENLAIDHIWVRNANVSNTKRILDETYTIAGITLHPSDHFGVQATVSKLD